MDEINQEVANVSRRMPQWLTNFGDLTYNTFAMHYQMNGCRFIGAVLLIGVFLWVTLTVGLLRVVSIVKRHQLIKVSKNKKLADINHRKTDTITDLKMSEIVGKFNGRVAKPSTVPVSVNYHFTRQCNYSCGFCFHTAKTSFVLPLEKAKEGLRMLAKAGMEKINFSGGEPFLEKRGEYVGDLVKFCKQELGISSVSIVSNGSVIREKWFTKYGEFLDILALSCDSFSPETNALIGRQQGQKNHLDSLIRVRNWCFDYKVAFKLNTVVNTYNHDEDMSDGVQLLNPIRWKVFQCLLLEGENCGDDAKRNAERYVISEDHFRQFIDRHNHFSCLVPESNEKMRFLDCSGGAKVPSPSILDVGVEAAMDRSGFDQKMFYKRGGKYEWSKADMKLDW